MKITTRTIATSTGNEDKESPEKLRRNFAENLIKTLESRRKALKPSAFKAKKVKVKS